MTRDETAKLLAIINSAYPTTFKVENKKQTLDTWAWLLGDYDYKAIGLALKTYIQVEGNKFPPSVAELIAMTRKPQELNTLSENEAWAMVRVAVRNGIYGAEEEYEKLPVEIKKAVGSASMIHQWAKTDSSELDTVVASNFMRSYKAIVKREQEKEALPDELKVLLESKLNSNLLEG